MASERVPAASSIHAVENSHIPLSDAQPVGSLERGSQLRESDLFIQNLERGEFEEDDNLPGVPVLLRNSSYGPVLPSSLSPARYPSEARPRTGRQRTGDTGIVPYNPHSMVDYIVPSVESKRRQANFGNRIAPTIRIAMEERDKYARKAKWTGYALNVAIGLQVLLGSLTTGLSAVATSGRSVSPLSSLSVFLQLTTTPFQAAIQTTILGGLSTIVASYLARSRGTNEPENSKTKVKELDHFIRECQSFELDHGHEVGDELDNILMEKRKELEVLLGNTSNSGDGEALRPKTSPV